MPPIPTYSPSIPQTPVEILRADTRDTRRYVAAPTVVSCLAPEGASGNRAATDFYRALAPDGVAQGNCFFIQIEL